MIQTNGEKNMADTKKLLKLQQKETDYRHLYETLSETYEEPSAKEVFMTLAEKRKERADRLRELTAYDLKANASVTENWLRYRKLRNNTAFLKRLTEEERSAMKEYKALKEEYSSFEALAENSGKCADLLMRLNGRRYKEEYLPIGRIREYVMSFAHKGKPVIVYLHGGPGESVIPYAGFIAKDIDFATMVFYDQRGTGRTQLKSRTSETAITFGALLTDLRSTIASLKQKYGCEKVILLGHSWGTVLGTQYALRFPEDLYCYIGVGQVVNFMASEKYCLEKAKEAMGTPDKTDQAILDKIGDYPYSMNPQNVLRSLIRARTLEKKYHVAADTEGIREIMKESGTFSWQDMPGMISMKQNMNLMRFLLTYDIAGNTEYKVPVFYILGTKDYQVSSEIASDYFETIQAPEKKLYWIEEAGHLPNLTKPKEFNEALKEIVQRYEDIAE